MIITGSQLLKTFLLRCLDSATFVKIGHHRSIVKKIVAKCRRNLGSDDQVIDSSANA